MDHGEDDSGWDGPNIRPPQLKQDLGGRDRPRHAWGHSGPDKRTPSTAHRTKSSVTGAPLTSRKHHEPETSASRSHGRSHSREKSRPESHHHPHRASDDLRNRIGHSKRPNDDNRNLTSTGVTNRDKDRQNKIRTDQSSLSESELRLRKFMSVATSDKHSKKSHRDFDKNETTKKSSTNTISSSKEVASRRDEEVRRKRRQVERQMKEEEERVRRKRERSKSRTGSETTHRSRKHRKKDDTPEKFVVTSSPLSPKSQIEISSDDDDKAGKNETDSNETEGSGSSSSDEAETSSESSSEDETGSEESGDTPDHGDEEVADETEPPQKESKVLTEKPQKEAKVLTEQSQKETKILKDQTELKLVKMHKEDKDSKTLEDSKIDKSPPERKKDRKNDSKATVAQKEAKSSTKQKEIQPSRKQNEIQSSTGQKEIERVKLDAVSKDADQQKKRKAVSPDSPLRLTSSDDEEHRHQSRTPSKSPTPRRRSVDQDTVEARASRFRASNEEGSPHSCSSFDDDLQNSSDNKLKNEPEEDGSETDPEDRLPPYLPSVYGCRSVEEFQCLNRVEEGTYGVVYRAKDKKTEKIVALKRLKMEREKEGFPITSLREINTLLISQHPNVVTVREIVVGSNMDKIYIVMDFVEHDLKGLMELMRQKKQIFLPAEVKCLMEQLLHAITYLHDNWILHRDLKTSNLLLSHNGILKVGDFGLAREYGSPLKPYTSVVVTLWYRAPELLLGIKEYSTHIDVWSIGCIFAELLQMEPLFTGKSDQDQLTIIFKLLGTPSEKMWAGFSKLPVVQKAALPEYPASNLRSKFPAQMLSDSGLVLLKKFLTYDPKKRITCEASLKDFYFDESPQAIDPSMFPTWPAKSEMSARGNASKKGASPKPPSGGGAFKEMNENDEEYNKFGGGFVLNPGKAPAPAPWNLKF